MKRKGILIVVSGFSGAGKGTLMKELIRRYDGYALSISMTTRAPRLGETNGQEYFFVTKEEFEKRIQEDGLVEYASYCGNYYGTPRAYVESELNQGKDVILEIEIQGALKIQEKFPDALLLFVTPPSAEELRRRLTARGTESAQAIDQRLQRAVEESAGMERYDFIVVNDRLDACVEELHGIIQAAHSTIDRNHLLIEEIRSELRELAKGEK